MPFQVVYGRDPPFVHAYSPREARLPTMDDQLQERDEFLMEIHDRLEQALLVHKMFYDRKHRLQEGILHR
jgi:hypothetical protein